MPTERERVAEAVVRLAYACDGKDWAGLRALVADRVRYDASRHRGGPAVELSAAEFTALARRSLDGFDTTHHALSNLLVTVDGDAAHCHAYVVAYHHVSTGPGTVDFCTMRGRCEFRLVAVGSQWRVREWTVVRTGPLEGSAEVYDIAAARSR
ncbi:hypothetical protein Val02_17590 [Virgisporangium aliadipatigenens]|uniref:SnoaL-like domain-containing protein n=1 Tax=Virgisporangium aliadipatigenens TaxID=741659 RepID=A0A8J3YJ80_9ACTN|nr:nuclear transport factor 2 family protein [Virgisporangium aliadipatigenens]GIJ44873.1 hypothetical protein Val02_17590 [Virgisporangium aliadipatigenens]